MSDSTSPVQPLEGLPEELAELDAELSRIFIEERPSFGPELRNELAREWNRPATPVRHRWVRHAVAACLAALIGVALTVPPARASLVQGIDRILGSLRGDEEVGLDAVPVILPEGEAPPLDRELPERPLPRPTPAAANAEVETVPEAQPGALPPFQPGVSAFPRLLDPSAGREVALRHYPEDLQEAGIGGVVRLHLWVKEDGSVESPQIPEQGTSGVLELDRAALEAATALRFRPALRAGMPVSTWVQFDMVFEAPRTDPVVEAPEELDTPGIPEVEGWEPPESWVEAAVVPAPIRMEARSLLVVAMGGTEATLERRFGPLEGVLSGDPPQGVNPLEWRTRVTRALEEARVRDPDNAAPYLALARIRRKQGLRDEAQLLFERGLARATRGSRPVSPRLVAELAYESGRIARERWLGWRNLGDVPTRFLAGRGCATRVGSGAVASPETLLAWNFSCPAALQAALAEGFEARPEGSAERGTMLSAFVEAVEAYPAHVGANTELLLELADEESWLEVLEGSRRFAWASNDHPNARLLEGLALQRLGRSEEALVRFQAALDRLDPEVAAQFRDLGGLIHELTLGRGGAALGVSDPILSTGVNEREVEHLARAAYAHLRFASLEADAAQVWVRYGRPARTRAFGAAPGLRLEFWDYGAGPDLTFHRPTSSRNGALTPEAEEYLLELSSFFPHWYGNGARPVRPLTAQLTRFRAEDRVGQSLRVRLRTPEGFATEVDELEVAVFTVDEDQAVQEVLRRKVYRGSGSEFDFTIPIAGESGLAIVELFDPVTRATAATRTSSDGPLGSVSELLLLDAERSASGPGGRAGAGLDALPDPNRNGDRLGVFAELYDLEPGSKYELTFELEAVGAAAPIPLDFRPWDGDEFRSESLRITPLEGPVLERAVLDLSGVPPGDYTLRMRVETQDGRVLTRERAGVGRSLGAAGGNGEGSASGFF
jgi:TonB family protein